MLPLPLPQPYQGPGHGASAGELQVLAYPQVETVTQLEESNGGRRGPARLSPVDLTIYQQLAGLNYLNSQKTNCISVPSPVLSTWSNTWHLR